MRYRSRLNLFIKKALELICPEKLRVSIYPMFRGRKFVNLNNSESFTSFINRNKLQVRFSEVLFVQDKLLAKKWVSLVAPNIKVPEVLLEADNINNVDFNDIPINSVLKTNHGCGYNFIYKGQDYDLDKMVNEFRVALDSPFNKAAVEWSYYYIKPKIFLEKLIPSDHGDLIDYKVFVIFGKARLVQVDLDRFTNHVRALYTPNWNILDVEFEYPMPKGEVPKPNCLGEMLQAAEEIAKPFPFLRVDFYIVGDDVYFGEVAHYPEGGYGLFDPHEFDKELMVSSIDDRSIDKRFLK